MIRDFAPGNYRFVPAVFQYSSGAAAAHGYEIERVRFDALVPLAEGFAQAAHYIRAAGRPLTAFCACELRSPAAVSEDGFRNFNLHYVKTLAEWGIYDGSTNPVARSNVCPPIAPPREPSFYAFCYAVPAPGATPTFVAAGSGERIDGTGPFSERVIAYADTSAAGMRRKAEQVIHEMERRLALLGGSWQAATAVQVYAVHEIHSFVADLLVERGAAAHGLTWHFARPPIIGLEYEMDVRAVNEERVIA